MKKLLMIFMFILSCSMVSAESIILDDFELGSLSSWDYYISQWNPTSTYIEVSSSYDGSTAIKAQAIANDKSICDTSYMRKIYDLHNTYYTNDTKLKVYLEFENNGSEGFPAIGIVLFDADLLTVGPVHVWYGKNIVGGQSDEISSIPIQYTELPSDKGYFTLDLSYIGDNAGTDLAYNQIQVYVVNRACEGTSSILLDHLVFIHGDEDTHEVPEFGLIAGGLALIGALTIFIIRRRH